MGSLLVTSLVSRSSADPLVEIRDDEKGYRVQLDAQAARQVARHLIEAVEASISDSFIFEYMQRKVNLTQPQAALVVADFREFRKRLPKAIETEE